MAKNIVWMSRHAPTRKQLAELDRLFPGHNLHIDPQSFDSAAEIVKRFRSINGDEMVVVAPWTVMRELINLGIRPIYAEMKSVPCSGEHEVAIMGRRPRCFNFVRFHRCSNVKLELTPLEPEGEPACT